MKTILNVVLLVGLLFPAMLCSGQPRKINVVGDSIKMTDAFFVGEMHYMYDMAPYKVSLLKYFRDKYGKVNLVLEMGRSRAYMYNQFLQTGDTMFLHYCNMNHWAYLELLRRENLKHKDSSFIIYGIDFERTDFVKATEIVLSKYSEAKKTKLYEYVTGFPDTINKLNFYRTALKKRTQIYSNGKKIFKGEEERLKTVLNKEDYHVLKEIFENPVSYGHYKKRDKDMMKNISQLNQQLNGNFVCVVGRAHTDIRTNRASNPFARRKSLLERFVLAFPDSKVTFIDMACKDCFGWREQAYPDVLKESKIALEAPFNKWNDENYYTLINQFEFKDIKYPYFKIPTYYTFFKDQINITTLDAAGKP